MLLVTIEGVPFLFQPVAVCADASRLLELCVPTSATSSFLNPTLSALLRALPLLCARLLADDLLGQHSSHCLQTTVSLLMTVMLRIAPWRVRHIPFDTSSRPPRAVGQRYSCSSIALLRGPKFGNGYWNRLHQVQMHTCVVLYCHVSRFSTRIFLANTPTYHPNVSLRLAFTFCSPTVFPLILLHHTAPALPALHSLRCLSKS